MAVSAEKCNALAASITNVWDEIKTKYIKPCKMALTECGIEGTYKAKVEELATALEHYLLKICDKYGVISANLDDIGKDIDGFVSAGKFNAALDSVSGAKVAETKKRGRKFQ